MDNLRRYARTCVVEAGGECSTLYCGVLSRQGTKVVNRAPFVSCLKAQGCSFMHTSKGMGQGHRFGV